MERIPEAPVDEPQEKQRWWVAEITVTRTFTRHIYGSKAMAADEAKKFYSKSGNLGDFESNEVNLDSLEPDDER